MDILQFIKNNFNKLFGLTEGCSNAFFLFVIKTFKYFYMIFKHLSHLNQKTMKKLFLAGLFMLAIVSFANAQVANNIKFKVRTTPTPEQAAIEMAAKIEKHNKDEADNNARNAALAADKMPIPTTKRKKERSN